jgi:hypothetical protein
MSERRVRNSGVGAPKNIYDKQRHRLKRENKPPAGRPDVQPRYAYTPTRRAATAREQSVTGLREPQSVFDTIRDGSQPIGSE